MTSTQEKRTLRWKRDVTLDGVVTICEAQEPYHNLFGEVEDAAEHWTVEERVAHADLGASAPQLVEALEAPLWLVWSHEHGCWWRATKCGYSMTVEEAGRY